VTSILNTMNTHPDLFDSAVSVWTRLALLLLICTGLMACGKKGPLYLPVDEETLQQLESVQEELDEAQERNRKKNSTTPEPAE